MKRKITLSSLKGMCLLQRRGVGGLRGGRETWTKQAFPHTFPFPPQSFSTFPPKILSSTKHGKNCLFLFTLSSSKTSQNTDRMTFFPSPFPPNYNKNKSFLTLPSSQCFLPLSCTTQKKSFLTLSSLQSFLTVPPPAACPHPLLHNT